MFQGIFRKLVESIKETKKWGVETIDFRYIMIYHEFLLYTHGCISTSKYHFYVSIISPLYSIKSPCLLVKSQFFCVQSHKSRQKSPCFKVNPAMWDPQTIPKLVQITPITLVYGTYRYTYWGS